jgi:hypothetical protein
VGAGQKAKRFPLLVIGGLFLVTACSSKGGGDTDVIETTLAGSSLIGPAGGTVMDSGGASVDVPPGALSEEESINIETYTDASLLPAPIGALGVPFVGGVSLEPDGLIFEQPVTITIPLTSVLKPGAEFPLLFYRKDLGAWEETDFMAVVNLDGQSAMAVVPHFSIYILQPSDLESAGLFGNVGQGDTYSSLFARVVARFSQLFPFDGEIPFSVPKYSCYVPVAMEFTFYHGGESGLQNPLNSKIGDEQDAELQLYYHRVFDEYTKIGGLENQIIGDFFVRVWFQSIPPYLTLKANESNLMVGEETLIYANVYCGDELMSSQSQKINFDLASGFGKLDPISAWTGTIGTAIGRAKTTFTADDTVSELATVIATYEWTSTDGIENITVVAQTDIYLLSVAGQYYGLFSGHQGGCQDADEVGYGNEYGFLFIDQHIGTQLTGIVPLVEFVEIYEECIKRDCFEVTEIETFEATFSGTVSHRRGLFSLNISDGTAEYVETYTYCKDGVCNDPLVYEGNASFNGIYVDYYESLNLYYGSFQDVSGDTCIGAFRFRGNLQ